MQPTGLESARTDFVLSSKIDLGQACRLAGSLIRKHVLVQYVGPDHEVLKTEEGLVRESSDQIRALVRDVVEQSGYDARVVQMAVYIRIRNEIRAVAELQDIEEEDVVRDAVLLSEQEALSLVTSVDLSDLEERSRKSPLQRGLARAS